MAENNETTAICIKDLAEGKAIQVITSGGVQITYTLDLVDKLIKRKQNDPALHNVDKMMFVNACIEWKANPYLDEAWLIPIRGAWKPVVAAKTKLRRAHECKGYKGFTCGWITKDGKRHTSGTECTAKPAEIIGAWCEIHRADEIPTYHELFTAECSVTARSGDRPLTMLLKTVRDQAVRLKYPELMCGAYTENEIGFYNQPPEPTPTPTAPGREERKKVDAKVTDTPATIAGLAEESMDLFVAAVSEKLEVQLGGDALYYFTQCVSYILGGEADSWKEHKNWTIEGANKFLKELKENGIPQTVLDMIPHQMSETEVEEHAEAKFGQESTETGDLKYQCQSPSCGKYFDKPKRGGKLPKSNDYAKLCPHCLTDDIVNREEVADVAE